MQKFRESDIKTNARLKNYPDFSLLQVCNAPIFVTGKFEKHDKSFFNFDKTEATKKSEIVVDSEELQNVCKIVKDPVRSLEESRRRARSAVRDIAYCNHFDMMFTLTFDGQKIDRYDPDSVYKAVRTWCTNMSQRKGLKYVAIPEYHKKKKGEDTPAIHIHGLAIFEGVDLVRATFKDGKPRVDSEGRPVYNIPSWRWGWSTAVPLDVEYTKAIAYVTKYIGKQDKKIFGKWYLSSRQTSVFKKRPEIIPLDDVDFWEFRDEGKLLSGVQFEQKVFRDITIVSEELWKDVSKNVECI